ncbi:MAG: hypothetical protein ACTSU9_00240 [Promethearchaeota archaeon]
MLGTNFLIFFKKSGDVKLEWYLMTEVCLGITISIIVGNIFFMTNIPFFSEISVIAIGVINLLIYGINEKRDYFITITITRETWNLIIISAVFFLLRLLCFDPDDLYLDDMMYYEGAVKFTQNLAGIAQTTSSSYFPGDIELAYPLGFPIFLGMFLKTGFITSKIALKILLMVVNSFVVFPTFAFLKKFVKETKISYMLLFLIVFNQWAFFEGPYLFVDGIYKLFLTMSLYNFTCFFKNKEASIHSLQFGIIFSVISFYIKASGSVQILAPVIAFILIFLVSSIKNSDKTPPWLKKLVINVNTPKLRKMWKYLLFQLTFFAIIAVPFFIRYYLRNGITVSDFTQFAREFSLYREGNNGQFTPVTGFSFAWLWEHFSYNFSYFVRNFSILTGFAYDLTFSMNDARYWVNLNISIIFFAFFAISQIYFWVKYAGKKPLYCAYHFILFSTTFVSLMLWGETYFMIHRNMNPLLILFIPSSYVFLKDVLKEIQKRVTLHINKEKVILFILSPCLFVTLFGSFGIFILYLGLKNMTFLEFFAWQFYGVIL